MEQKDEKSIFTPMRTGQQSAIIFKFASCIFMMLALAWLTVSVPFVNAVQKKAETAKSSHAPVSKSADNETAPDPFSNSTEEQTSSGQTTIAEEYLHHTYTYDYSFPVPSAYYKIENVKTYIAFHGELLSPPPEA